jgi:hypothetical protein
MIWVVASIGAFQLPKGYNLEMMSLYIYIYEMGEIVMSHEDIF